MLNLSTNKRAGAQLRPNSRPLLFLARTRLTPFREWEANMDSEVDTPEVGCLLNCPGLTSFSGDGKHIQPANVASPGIKVKRNIIKSEWSLANAMIIQNRITTTLNYGIYESHQSLFTWEFPLFSKHGSHTHLITEEWLSKQRASLDLEYNYGKPE